MRVEPFDFIGTNRSVRRILVAVTVTEKAGRKGTRSCDRLNHQALPTSEPDAPSMPPGDRGVFHGSRTTTKGLFFLCFSPVNFVETFQKEILLSRTLNNE